MESIEIIANGSYIPKNKVTNAILAKQLGITEEYIFKRTGIKQRFFASEAESIENMATNAAKDALEKAKVEKEKIDMIVVATTATECFMPGISYQVQRQLDIKECICFDLLAGCSGYINGMDIIRNYIALGKIQKAILIGVENLSAHTKKDDIGTAILLSDGAGATIIQKAEQEKKYESYIKSEGQQGDILISKVNEFIYMEGKEVYKYAITETVENIKELLKRSGEKLENIKYIIPHQSNDRILQAIANRLKIDESKVYRNIETKGNTFCASIPIVLEEMQERELLNPGDKIILLGYGGGLNTGSILMEV